MSSDEQDSANESRNRTQRTRKMKRSFVLLRRTDALRVLRPAITRTLQNCGRIKEIEFANNNSNAEILELLENSFGHLRGATLAE